MPTVTEQLEIIPAGLTEYEKLAGFHYREGRLVAAPAVYAIIDRCPNRRREAGVVGAIVYSMPTPNSQLRNVATGGIFTGCSNRTLQLQMINDNLRRISRVVIDPRYRGLGLATRLVRETMRKLEAPIIEAMAVMGNFTGFFESAGMTAYHAPPSARCVRLKEALAMMGIEPNAGIPLIDARAVHRKINRLSPDHRRFIEREFKTMLSPHASRRLMPHGLERTKYILSRLTDRPVYYIWFNPRVGIRSKRHTPSARRWTESRNLNRKAGRNSRKERRTMKKPGPQSTQPESKVTSAASHPDKKRKTSKRSRRRAPIAAAERTQPKAAKLTGKQQGVLDDLFDSGLDEPQVLKKHGVPDSLFRRWLAQRVFAEELRFRIDSAHRQSELLIARFAPIAAARLIQLATNAKEKGETSRKACLDIINLGAGRRADHDRPDESSAENETESLDPDTASRILAALAKCKPDPSR